MTGSIATWSPCPRGRPPGTGKVGLSAVATGCALHWLRRLLVAEWRRRMEGYVGERSSEPVAPGARRAIRDGSRCVVPLPSLWRQHCTHGQREAEGRGKTMWPGGKVQLACRRFGSFAERLAHVHKRLRAFLETCHVTRQGSLQATRGAATVQLQTGAMPLATSHIWA